MAKPLHVTKAPSDGWAVTPEGTRRASSVHPTQGEAIKAGRKAAQVGGAELIVHRADGKLRDATPTGKNGSRIRAGRTTPSPRAPRSEGPRTTLRLPDPLAAAAERLADELEISRNDAVLRLATRGARLYEHEQHIAARRAERWSAVIAGSVNVDEADLPSEQEARGAVLRAREQDSDQTR